MSTDRHQSFKRGYIEGYQSITKSTAIPSIPATPAVGVGKEYEEGYKRGVDAAKSFKGIK